MMDKRTGITSIEEARRRRIAVQATAEPQEPKATVPLIDLSLDIADVGIVRVDGDVRVTLPGLFLVDDNMRMVPAVSKRDAVRVAEHILAAARAAECPACVAAAELRDSMVFSGPRCEHGES